MSVTLETAVDRFESFASNGSSFGHRTLGSLLRPGAIARRILLPDAELLCERPSLTEPLARATAQVHTTFPQEGQRGTGFLNLCLAGMVLSWGRHARISCALTLPIFHLRDVRKAKTKSPGAPAPTGACRAAGLSYADPRVQ